MKNLLIIVMLLSSFSSADENKPIRERIKWIDEKKCTISVDGEIHSYIPFLASAYTDERTNNEKIKEKIISAVNRGCDVNSTDLAVLSAFNVGILFNKTDLVKLMLSLKADPKLTIKSESKLFAGLNSIEFIEKLNLIKEPRNGKYIFFQRL